MAKRPVVRDIRIVHPSMFIPEGMEDEWRYSDDVEFIEDVPIGVGEGDFGDTLSAPEVVVVVSQTPHKTGSGSVVVDLVVDVQDIQGALTYEFRISKEKVVAGS